MLFPCSQKMFSCIVLFIFTAMPTNVHQMPFHWCFFFQNFCQTIQSMGFFQCWWTVWETINCNSCKTHAKAKWGEELKSLSCFDGKIVCTTRKDKFFYSFLLRSYSCQTHPLLNFSIAKMQCLNSNGLCWWIEIPSL